MAVKSAAVELENFLIDVGVFLESQ